MRRRLLRLWQVAVVIVVTVLVGTLLGAEPLHSRADSLDPSPWRTAALAVTGSLAEVSEFLHLDRPWKWAAGSSEIDEPSAVSTTVGTTTTLAGHAGSTTSSHTIPGSAAGSTISSTTTASSTTTTSSSTTTTTLPLFTVKEPLRVLMVGDSMMMMVGYGMMRQAERHPAMKVQVATKVSSGLVRPDFFDWPKRIARGLSEFHPHVTVMIFGGNEKQTMRHEGKTLEPFSEAWSTEYSRRVADAIAMSTDNGAQVIWVGMPIMRSPKFSETCRRLNAFYAAACAENPDATYIDGYSLFADEQGQYSAYLIDPAGQRKLMREKDGIHLTNAGGDRAAAAVMEVLRESVRLEK
ncbi:MAG: DUF459 domain-containing protein [Thermoleophilia bacterium]|nr:DUF459 domain-containing protein [Thermoleophilia bacterium]